MIAKLKKYVQACRHRGAMLEEARALLRALELPSGSAPGLEILSILMTIGLGHLRRAKTDHDRIKAAREMAARIQAGPRPSYQEAGLN